MRPVVYYCYDAYCGWCYGFSPVIKKLAAEYAHEFYFEVLSGGMISVEQQKPVSAIASYVSSAYKNVEAMTGIRFGDDFLWHIFNPDESDWILCSEKSAIALTIFKEWFPEKQMEFASDLQYALNFEGRDLTDDEAYRHLLAKYEIDPETFYEKLHSEAYRDKARYEYALCQQLQVTGFPQVLMQVNDQKLYLLAKGYTDYETLKSRIEAVKKEIG